MKFSEWQGVPGYGTTREERWAQDKATGWIWKGKPVTVEGYLVERREVKVISGPTHYAEKLPDGGMRVGVFGVVKEPTGKTHTLLSVPDKRMGVFDPYRNYSFESDDLDWVVALSREELIDKVQNIAKNYIARAHEYRKHADALAYCGSPEPR